MLVIDDNLNNILRENKMRNCSSVNEVKITEVSLVLKLVGINRKDIVLEVIDIASKRPFQWVDLPENSSKVILSGLIPDTFLELKLIQIASSNPLVTRDVLSKKIFTGGCLTHPTDNLTRTLDLFYPYRAGE